MSETFAQPSSGNGAADRSSRPIIVLLVDDDRMVGKAITRMLSSEKDVTVHFCDDPRLAMELALKITPTVILQDLVMPEIDGLTLVKTYRAETRTRNVPLVVLSAEEDPKTKAEAFALGANDYLIKLPDKLELIARIRYHSNAYIRLLERNEAFDRLQASERRMADELAMAAKYVQGLLPKPLDGTISSRWCYQPSDQLGGDAFGYHWVDEDHLAMYLFDVSNHGVGPALLSVSILSVLRTQALANVDFRQPAAVLGALNNAFQMEKHDDMFFTIWYGVYDRKTGLLAYANGGHPPALLLHGDSPTQLRRELLQKHGPVIGGFPDQVFPSASVQFSTCARLYLYSDGAFEIFGADGLEWTLDGMLDTIEHHAASGQALGRLRSTIRERRGKDQLDDDLSLLEMVFDRQR
jgi:phosphoserine phosphatase RsbU/P